MGVLSEWHEMQDYVTSDLPVPTRPYTFDNYEISLSSPFGLHFGFIECQLHK
jgi:hypothetical protein